MADRPRAVTASLVFGIGLASCSGGGGGGGGGNPPPPAPITIAHAFPAGDAKAAGGGTAWDIIGVTTTLSSQAPGANGNAYDLIRVDVTFAQDVTNALPLPGKALASGNQLGLSVGFDTDSNPATGDYAGCVAGKTPYEYGSDAGATRLNDGNFLILGPGGAPVGSNAGAATEAMTTVSNHTISQTFYLPSIGIISGPTAPHFLLGVSAINGSAVVDSVTDCVPTDKSEISVS